MSPAFPAFPIDPHGARRLQPRPAMANTNTVSESPALPVRPGPAESRAKCRVLVVDDEESPRSGLTALLSTWGYEVAAVENGQQGLERATVFRPSAVITDLVMPGLSGIDLLRELKHELPGAAIVILTGHASIETAMTAVREGAYDYLTKPIDPRRLRIVLEKAIEQAEVVRDVTLLRRQLRDMVPPPAATDSIVLPLGSTFESAERQLLLRTLASTNNNKTRAAEILGVTPKTLHNKLRRYARESP